MQAPLPLPLDACLAPHLAPCDGWGLTSSNTLFIACQQASGRVVHFTRYAASCDHLLARCLQGMVKETPNPRCL